MRSPSRAGVVTCALAPAIAVTCLGVASCTTPLLDRVIECVPGDSRTCPDGWRCRMDEASGHPRCFASGPAATAIDASTAAEGDARAHDAPTDASPDAGRRDAFVPPPSDMGPRRPFDPPPGWAPEVADVESRDAEPPDGATRATCRSEWERMLGIPREPEDMEGPWCESGRSPADSVFYCGHASAEECACNWEGRLRGEFECRPRPAQVFCSWVRRCGSPHDDPSQRRLYCNEVESDCLEITRGWAGLEWSGCFFVLLTPPEQGCVAPRDLPRPTSGESAIPLPDSGCCVD
ncbi:MAG: hypothetical protein IT379_41860 [Deltaproteobacteria bacterium]|nr:hypothetical protein [Deltaproteobacteria bacterium]